MHKNKFQNKINETDKKRSLYDNLWIMVKSEDVGL